MILRYRLNLCDLLRTVGRCEIIQTLVTLQELFIIHILLSVAVEIAHVLLELLVYWLLKVVLVMLRGGLDMGRLLLLLLSCHYRLCRNLIGLEIFFFQFLIISR